MDNFFNGDSGHLTRPLQIPHEPSWVMSLHTHSASNAEANDPESAGERMAELIAQSCISDDDDGDDAAKLQNRPLLPLASSLASTPAMATGSWNASVAGTAAAVSAIGAASPPQQPLHPYNLESYQSQQLCSQRQLLLQLLAPQPRLAPSQYSPPLTGVSAAHSSPRISAGSSPPFCSHPSSPDCFTPPRYASPPAQPSYMTTRRSSPAASSPGDASSLGGSPTSVLGQRGSGMEGWDLLYAAAQKIEQQQKQLVQRGERAGPSCAMNLEARFASRLKQTAGARSPFHQQQPQQQLRRQQQQHLQQPQCRRGGPRHRGGASALSGSAQTLRNPLPQQQQQQQQGSPLRRCSTIQSVDTTRKLCQTLSAPHRQLSSLPPSSAVAADATCRTPVLSSPASPAPVASACPPSPLLLGGTGVFHPMRSSPPLGAAAHPAPSASSHTHAHSQRHTADGSSGNGSTNGSGCPSAQASPSSARGGGCKKANRPAPTVYLPARLVKVLGLDVDPESNVVLGRSAVAAAAAATPQQQQAPPNAAVAAGHPSRQHGNDNKAAVVVRPAPIIKLAPDNIATCKRGGCGGNGGRGWRCAAPGGVAGAPPGGNGRRASGRPAGAATSLAPASPAAPSVPAAWAGVAAQPAPGQGSSEWSAAANLPVEWVY